MKWVALTPSCHLKCFINLNHHIRRSSRPGKGAVTVTEPSVFYVQFMRLFRSKIESSVQIGKITITFCLLNTIRVKAICSPEQIGSSLVCGQKNPKISSQHRWWFEIAYTLAICSTFITVIIFFQDWWGMKRSSFRHPSSLGKIIHTW